MNRKMAVLVTAGLVAVSVMSASAGAVAGTMITGKQIKDGSVTGVDIKDGSIRLRDLAAAARPKALPHGAMLAVTGLGGCPSGTTDGPTFVAQNWASWWFGISPVVVNTTLTSSTFDKYNLYLENSNDPTMWVDVTLCRIP